MIWRDPCRWKRSKKFPLELLTDVVCGDTILMCDGVAISKVQKDVVTDKEYVPRHSR